MVGENLGEGGKAVPYGTEMIMNCDGTLSLLWDRNDLG